MEGRVRRRRFIAFFVSILATLAFALPVRASAADAASDRKALLTGITEVAAPGIPGALCVFGREAFALVAGRAGERYAEPVAAASRLGRGRVVAFGHDGYFGEDALKAADTGALLVNALRWASGGKERPRVAVLMPDGEAMRAFLGKQGLNAKALPVQTAKGDDLRGVDVVVIVPLRLSAETRDAVREFTRAGGGLVAAQTGWGWLQLNPGRTLAQNDGNLLLAGSGLLWSSGMLERTAPAGFRVGAENLDRLNASTALDYLLKQGGGDRASDAPPAAAAGAVWVVSQAAQALPDNDTLLLPRLRRLANEHRADFSDLDKNPVTMESRLLDRLVMTLQVREAISAPPQKVTAHPSAASFPGSVPRDAPRVTRTVRVDLSVPGWHGTGVYAAPGEPLTVSAPAGTPGQRLRVRIGAHSDRLWHLPAWKRAPEITRTFALDTPTVTVANAFGGAVFIEVPRRDGGSVSPGTETVSIAIKGGVDAPRYVRGKTGLKEWRERIRAYPAPWAELEGKGIILTVPSSVVRSLDDPEALMTYWDEVMDLCADLYAVPRQRPRPERYCVDRQISAGYMHAGYPIMTGPDVAERFVDLSVLRGGDGGKVWGFYHELGHNFQERDWNWNGTGEVTNNLFSLYGCEKLNGVTVGAHSALVPDKLRGKMREYFAAGAKYESLTRDPFLFLAMYIQLQKQFGWDLFTRTFAEYGTLSDAERPKTDAEKRDQWLVRLSRQAGRNLGPFFVAWGVPTSEAARQSVAHLPAWMPEEMQKLSGSVSP